MVRNKGKFVQRVAEDPALRGQRIDEVALISGGTVGSAQARPGGAGAGTRDHRSDLPEGSVERT